MCSLWDSSVIQGHTIIILISYNYNDCVMERITDVDVTVYYTNMLQE